MQEKIKAMIVDDSALVRQVLKEVLDNDPQIEVIAVASDPIFAQRHLETEWPDVIVLDVEMPRMDGITFLKQIMKERLTPVIICSTLTEKGAQITLQAMEHGAIDIITKPKVGLKGFLEDEAIQFVQSVKSAARASMKKVKDTLPLRKPEPKLNADAVIPHTTISSIGKTTDKIIAIGASTGGTQALEKLLTALPRGTTGIIIVQHMPEHFTKAFADRLNSICEIEVKEGETGDRIIPGKAVIARGNAHLILKRSGAQYKVEVKDGPLVNRHRPSVDVLFRSVAKEAGQNAMGVILTGMGDDGARGMKEMKEAGAYNIAQNEETSVVYGMPKEAVKAGGVDEIIALDKIPEKMIKFRDN